MIRFGKTQMTCNIHTDEAEAITFDTGTRRFLLSNIMQTPFRSSADVLATLRSLKVTGYHSNQTIIAMYTSPRRVCVDSLRSQREIQEDDTVLENNSFWNDAMHTSGLYWQHPPIRRFYLGSMYCISSLYFRLCFLNHPTRA